jgi:CRISPR-associated protein Cas1
VKKILFTDKSETLFLEQARVFVENDTVVFAQSWGEEPQRYNVPYRNTQVLVLGKGTSITSDAINKLGEAGVIIATSKSGGVPLLMANIVDYHPNEYMQNFCKRYFIGEIEQLIMAKQLMKIRLDFTEKMIDEHSPIDEDDIQIYRNKIEKTKTIAQILGTEGDFIKNNLYSKYASRYLNGKFSRTHIEKNVITPEDNVNALLNAGNNIVYGMAANAIWSLGLSPAFPLIHGRTNNSGLIFDIADLVKDAIVLPWAFEYYNSTMKEAVTELRYRLKNNKADHIMINGLKSLCFGNEVS